MDTSTLNTMIAYQRWAQEKFYRKATKIPSDMLLERSPPQSWEFAGNDPSSG